ncbi:MAG TPA: DUF445 domain-containing protein [Gemmatimonadales bacterium]|jgi:uncharacterized membrane-anchored protein YjiN (DUF445 family)|nr:DUF445 domain-containing protein [Gemmatimonadales bacterium]
MTAPPPLADEASRKAALRQMKLAASGLLLVALVIFMIAKLLEPLHPWLGYVRATAEASLVGGLADWFAVTALFRRPLGLPIPHTAIMQTQKDRVGRILGNFVQNHFLSRAVLDARLAGIKPAERLGDWLDTPGNPRRLAQQVASGLAQAVTALPEAEVKEFMQRSAVTRLESVQLAPLIGDVLTVATADGRPQELLDEATRLIGSAVVEGHDAIRDKVRQESPRWLPLGVRDAVAERMIGGVQRMLDEITHDPAHPLRRRFEVVVQEFIQRLKTSPEMIARTERLKQDLLGHPVVEDLVSSVWDRARRAAERYREDPEHASLEPLEEALMALAASLRDNPELRGEIDHFLADVLAAMLAQHRQEIADLIAATVRDWDPQVAASRIELAVGRDLQFIRLNGTLVGGLAGLVIYAVARLF